MVNDSNPAPPDYELEDLISNALDKKVSFLLSLQTISNLGLLSSVPFFNFMYIYSNLIRYITFKADSGRQRKVKARGLLKSRNTENSSSL